MSPPLTAALTLRPCVNSLFTLLAYGVRCPASSSRAQDAPVPTALDTTSSPPLFSFPYILISTVPQRVNASIPFRFLTLLEPRRGKYSSGPLEGKEICRFPFPLLLIVLFSELIYRTVK